MIAKASLKYARGSTKKYKLIVDLIRGKKAEEALSILTSVNKGPKTKLIKLVNSAVANAKKKEPDISRLYISKITADQAPSYKRFRAEAFGRASVIRKRGSHISVELERTASKAQHTNAKVEQKNLNKTMKKTAIPKVKNKRRSK